MKTKITENQIELFKANKYLENSIIFSRYL